MSKTTAEILKKARTLIETKGWVRGMYGDSSCGYCAAGAIDAADPTGAHLWAARRALTKAIGWPHNDGWGVPGWNDDRKRTKKQVLGAFTRAINAELKSNS